MLASRGRLRFTGAVVFLTTTTALTLGQRQPCFACSCGARRAARQRVSRLPGGGVALAKLGGKLARDLGAGRQPAGQLFTSLMCRNFAIAEPER